MDMRVITWNCGGALRKKIDLLKPFNADLLIIQEAENPELSTKAYREWAGDYLWIGTNKNKGIGVFSKHPLKALDWNADFSIPGITHSKARWKTSDLEAFLPFECNGQVYLAVWTKSGGSDAAFSYIGQFWKYLQLHKNEIQQHNCIVLGDFNSNVKWDKPDAWWRHSEVVDELDQLNFGSLYHHQLNEAQGNETEPTFFHQYNLNKPYHIDYVFMPNHLLSISKLAIGNTEETLQFSDHRPLIIDLG
jgi:exonuclease III